MTAATGTKFDIIETEALPGGADGPNFAEPWQAQAFACAIQLSRRGLFSWNEWVEVLSAEIKAHPATPREPANAAYYRQWLAALETIVGLKGAASSAEITARQEAWRQAYLNTPHGQPVELSRAWDAPAGDGRQQHHDHYHDHHRDAAPKPVAVSPATRK